MTPDLSQEQLHRVGGRLGELILAILRRRGGASTVVAKVDAARPKLLVDHRDLILVEVGGVEDPLELGELEAVALVGELDQALDCRSVRLHRLRLTRAISESTRSR